MLDMGPFMADRRSGPRLFELFGVLVHAGHSVHSGHYYCFVRGPNGVWHQMDDTQVSQVLPRPMLLVCRDRRALPDMEGMHRLRASYFSVQ